MRTKFLGPVCKALQDLSQNWIMGLELSMKALRIKGIRYATFWETEN